MGKLPAVSGRAVVKALGTLGYAFDRQRGSHMILRHRDPPHRRVVVPDHPEVAKGTLRAIIREVGLSVEGFSALLCRADERLSVLKRRAGRAPASRVASCARQSCVEAPHESVRVVPRPGACCPASARCPSGRSAVRRARWPASPLQNSPQ